MIEVKQGDTPKEFLRSGVNRNGWPIWIGIGGRIHRNALVESHIMKYAYHYTVGQYFENIMEDAQLKPTSAYIAEREKPILWFSMDQVWEPTACKATEELGVIKRLTKNETFQLGCGLVRFGVDPHILIPWPKIGHMARMSKRIQKSLTREGIRQGANPCLWMGTLEPVVREKWAVVDVWKCNEDFNTGKWVRVLE